MISHRRRNVIDLTAIALGLAIGAILAALLLPLARAEADEEVISRQRPKLAAQAADASQEGRSPLRAIDAV